MKQGVLTADRVKLMIAKGTPCPGHALWRPVWRGWLCRCGVRAAAAAWASDGRNGDAPVGRSPRRRCTHGSPVDRRNLGGAMVPPFVGTPATHGGRGAAAVRGWRPRGPWRGRVASVWHHGIMRRASAPVVRRVALQATLVHSPAGKALAVAASCASALA